MESDTKSHAVGGRQKTERRRSLSDYGTDLLQEFATRSAH